MTSLVVLSDLSNQKVWRLHGFKEKRLADCSMQPVSVDMRTVQRFASEVKRSTSRRNLLQIPLPAGMLRRLQNLDA